MKNLIEKLAHLGMGGLIGAMITNIVLFQEELSIGIMMVMPFIGTICVAVLSLIKAVIVDETFKLYNFLLPIIGSCLIHITVLIGLLSR